MNVELKPEEFRKLVELAYMGEWMINAHHDPDFQDETASSVLQQLLAAGPLDEVTKDQETGEHLMDTDWTERIYDDYIADYDDHVFWDELVERMAQRDLAHERGVSTDSVSRDEDLFELRPLEERYRLELEENGLERFHIREY